MRIIRMLHATFLVADLGQARVFYERVLELRPNPGRPEMSFPGVWYDVGTDQQIHLMQLPNPDADMQRPSHGGRDRHTALAVDDLDGLIARLALARINYTVSQTGRRALFCRDPDNNTLEFIESLD
jgi:glyoxylase I family protein